MKLARRMKKVLMVGTVGMAVSVSVMADAGISSGDMDYTGSYYYNEETSEVYVKYDGEVKVVSIDDMDFTGDSIVYNGMEFKKEGDQFYKVTDNSIDNTLPPHIDDDAPGLDTGIGRIVGDVNGATIIQGDNGGVMAIKDGVVYVGDGSGDYNGKAFLVGEDEHGELLKNADGETVARIDRENGTISTKKGTAELYVGEDGRIGVGRVERDESIDNSAPGKDGTPDNPISDDESIDNTVPEPKPDPDAPIRDTERIDEVKANIQSAGINAQSGVEAYSKRLSQTRSEMKGIGAQSAAMTASAVAATQQLEVGEVGIGVGHGSYSDQSAQSFSLGLRPTENINVNTSWSHSDSNADMWSVGAGYKFNLFGK